MIELGKYAGAVIGAATLSSDGVLLVTLTEAADEPIHRSGETIVTTTDSIRLLSIFRRFFGVSIERRPDR